MVFKNREDAAKKLVNRVSEMKFDIILGITRGGLVLAKVIGLEKDEPWGALVVKKIGHPAFPELALGAVSANGEAWIDWNLVQSSGITEKELKSIWKAKEQEAREASDIYKIPDYKLQGKKVLIVDDGVATAATALTAIRAVRKEFPRQVVFASPICSNEALIRLESEAKTVCLDVPIEFWAVGQFFEEFPEVLDPEVLVLVKEGQRQL